MSISDATKRVGRRRAGRGGFWLGLFALLIASPGARAQAPATNAAQGSERDLGLGLAYHRIHQLPADLPAAEGAKAPPCVVDLRYVRTNAAGARAFFAWLASRASPHTPVFVLANADTDADLLAARRGHPVAAGVMWLGIAAKNFQPDVAVQASAENERSAYDAFEKGATMASLLTDNPGKIRYDETSLGKDRRPEPAPPAAGDAAAKEAPALPPTDAVLQRAVHVHRGLLALRKL